MFHVKGQRGPDGHAGSRLLFRCSLFACILHVWSAAAEVFMQGLARGTRSEIQEMVIFSSVQMFGERSPVADVM